LRRVDASQSDLIRDVVYEGLSPYSVSALEKDLHLSFILELFRSSQPVLQGIVLCGGTSLVKGHRLISRMSEDMDFKVIVDSDLTGNQRSMYLSGLKRKISSLLVDAGFLVSEVSAHDRNSYFRIELEYSPSFPREAALRPHILLEFTAETPLFPAPVCESNSLLGLAISQPLHSVAFACLEVEETVAQKSVAFLRRSRSSLSGSEEPRDRRLVRHVYDIGTIGTTGIELHEVQRAFDSALARDVAKFAAQDPEFARDPRMELARASAKLNRDLLHADYQDFVDSLVAGPALSFDQAFDNFRALAAELLP
jgi:hypothetical protein